LEEQIEKTGSGNMEQDVLQELVVGILAVMQEQLVSIVLYGSVARGTNTEDSDVDVALLMKGELDCDTEDKLSDFIVDMNLKYDKVFSVIDIDIDKFSKWEKVIPFYQNMNKEGIVLWKAA
jgi:predicted nucleotidyltransferase